MVCLNRGSLARTCCLLSVLLLGADRASAGPLISFVDSDPANPGPRLFLKDQTVSWAASWTQSVTASDVTIEAWVARPISEIGPAELGEAYLMSAIGLGTTAASQVVAPVSFTTPLVGNPDDLNAVTPVTLFTGLTLSPGTYYLVLGGPVSAVWADPFDWLGQESSTVTTAAGFSLGPLFQALSGLDAFEPNNEFVASRATQPFFRVSGVEAATVPEPATLLLVGSGIVATIRARKRSTARRR
jgi:hypothetical protein